MADRIPEYEAGTTVQLTWTASVPPDGAPTVTVRELPLGTVVSTATGQGSSNSSFYQFFTLPDHEGQRHFLAEWRAVKTYLGTTYPFVSRSAFLSENSSPNL